MSVPDPKSAEDVTLALLDALGINSTNVTHVTYEHRIGKLPVVTVAYLPSKAESARLERVEQFEVQPLNEESR